MEIPPSRQNPEKQKILRNLAYERIKGMMLENKLSFEKKINEKQLSGELGFSRTPFREAMIMLEQENLVTHGEDGGFLIRQFSVKEIGDVFDLREIIERSQAGLIAEKITDDQIEDLADALEKIRKTINAGDLPKAMFQAMNFHIDIIAICGNMEILDVIRNCNEKLTLISWSLQEVEASNESQIEHEKILSALKVRDGEKLGIAMNEHLSQTKKRVLHKLMEGTDRLYFSPRF